MLANLEKTILENGLVKPGQQVVVISGYPIGDMRPPNLAMLYTIGQSR
jgi:pyruvate kinase